MGLAPQIGANSIKAKVVKNQTFYMDINKSVLLDDDESLGDDLDKEDDGVDTPTDGAADEEDDTDEEDDADL